MLPHDSFLQQIYRTGNFTLPVKLTKQTGGKVLFPSPNYMHISGGGSPRLGYSKDAEGNVIEVSVMPMTVQLVYWEELPASDTQPSELRQVVFDNSNLEMPSAYFDKVLKPEIMKANVEALNMLLSQFAYRGCLQKQAVTVDEVALDAYISHLAEIEAQQQARIDEESERRKAEIKRLQEEEAAAKALPA